MEKKYLGLYSRACSMATSREDLRRLRFHLCRLSQRRKYDPMIQIRLPIYLSTAQALDFNLQPPPLPRTLERQLDDFHRQRRLLRLDDQRFLVLSDGGI